MFSYNGPGCLHDHTHVCHLMLAEVSVEEEEITPPRAQLQEESSDSDVGEDIIIIAIILPCTSSGITFVISFAKFLMCVIFRFPTIQVKMSPWTKFSQVHCLP